MQPDAKRIFQFARLRLKCFKESLFVPNGCPHFSTLSHHVFGLLALQHSNPTLMQSPPAKICMLGCARFGLAFSSAGVTSGSSS